MSSSADNNKKKLSPVSAAFVEHQSYLKRFLRRFLSRAHDIEDVVQDTYIKARCAEEVQVITSPKSFLFKVARNEALNQLRKKSQRITDYIEEVDFPDAEVSVSTLEDEAIVKQRLGIFCESVLEMSPRCRRVFLMVKVYGMSYQEVADELGISLSGVEKHVAKGFQICNAYADRIERPSTWGATEVDASEVERKVESKVKSAVTKIRSAGKNGGVA